MHKNRIGGDLVTDLETALRRGGHSDLADTVARGPIAKAHSACVRGADADADADDCDSDLEEEIEDVIDEDNSNDDDDNNDPDSDSDDDGDGFDDEEGDDEFEEALSDDLDGDEDDEEDSEAVAQAGPVILDMNRVYSKAELDELRGIAKLCISRDHLVPNAKALLRSIKEYESHARR
jgi:hypothetical protein